MPFQMNTSILCAIIIVAIILGLAIGHFLAVKENKRRKVECEKENLKRTQQARTTLTNESKAGKAHVRYASTPRTHPISTSSRSFSSSSSSPAQHHHNHHNYYAATSDDDYRNRGSSDCHSFSSRSSSDDGYGFGCSSSDSGSSSYD